MADDRISPVLKPAEPQAGSDIIVTPHPARGNSPPRPVNCPFLPVAGDPSIYRALCPSGGRSWDGTSLVSDSRKVTTAAAPASFIRLPNGTSASPGPHPPDRKPTRHEKFDAVLAILRRVDTRNRFPSSLSGPGRSCAAFQVLATLLRVVRLRAWVAWVLVAFWLPASAHPHQQRSGLDHAFSGTHLHGDHSHHRPPGLGHRSCPSDSQASADGQCWRCKTPPSPVPPIDSLRSSGAGSPPLPPISELPRSRPAIPFVLPACRPPGLAPSWQFLVRAARLARPPSARS